VRGVFEQVVVAEYTGQTNTYPILPAFLKYLPNIKIRELNCTYATNLVEQLIAFV
jgi:hypothetical protein